MSRTRTNPESVTIMDRQVAYRRNLSQNRICCLISTLSTRTSPWRLTLHYIVGIYYYYCVDYTHAYATMTARLYTPILDNSGKVKTKIYNTFSYSETSWGRKVCYVMFNFKLWAVAVVLGWFLFFDICIRVNERQTIYYILFTTCIKKPCNIVCFTALICTTNISVYTQTKMFYIYIHSFKANGMHV